mgnify:CR=1 FL=1
MKEVEELKKALEREIEISNNILYDKFGKDKVDEFYKLMDEHMSEAIIKQFDNFAEIKHKEE